MTDSQGLPKPIVKDQKPGLLARLSLIWLVPVLALAGALGLAWDTYRQRDVTIEITFPEASGIEPGKTLIKFREVTVGTVAELGYSEDLTKVVVQANIHRKMAQYLDTDTQFWLVTAKITASGVTGLNTLLSGSHINVEWDTDVVEPSRKFVALADAPIILPGAKGAEILLTSPVSGSVAVGAPILHKGVAMGKVEAVGFDQASDSVLITAFVNHPYDALVNTGTRFWNASGINIELNDSGLQLNVGSLSSLLQGGIEFDTTMSGGAPIGPKATFDLYATKDLAKESLLDDDLRATVHLTSSFAGSVKGLKEGSDVLFRGLKIGQIINLSATARTDDAGKPEIVMEAAYTVQPGRLGLAEVKTKEQTLDLLAEMVSKSNLRARLAPNSIFSGGLHIELYEDPEAESAALKRDQIPYPVLPSTPTSPETLTIAAESVLNRVASLPIEELMDRAIKVISEIDTLLANQDTQALPADVRALLSNVNTIATSDGLKKLPDDLHDTLATVQDLLDTFETNDGVTNIVESLKDVRTAVASISTASDKLPALLEDIDTFVGKANGLPLESVVTSADDVLKSTNEFLSNEDMAQVPGALSGALEQANLTLKELRDGGAVAQLNRTLSSAGDAAESISIAVKDLPELAKRLDQLADTAEDTIGAYGPSSPVNREVQAAIQDLRSAVKSLNALVQAIRRKPNSLLVGR
ncbi:MlaD family protein [Falsiruegeria litorea]|uniref:MCE family protein n=1 Tax=Falsiruegeria litorea TaxID=1280831 RepID=A0ABS5WV15_9RHOB|nr:MlaD family protein [Falsiruegeria litorea]MBT3142348.1 MCE family protein [Falsiruegeria litorea]MBT8169424.1 MCE family protein [Falsiruegeria litorea]